MDPKPTKRRTWLDNLPRGLRARFDVEIDCDVESLSAIYRRWNLVRYCQPRTFRLYGGPRRQRIREYEATRGRAASRAAQEKSEQQRDGAAGMRQERQA